MQTTNDSPRFDDDTVWSLIAEGEISDLYADKQTEDEPLDGSLLRCIQNMGLPSIVNLKIQETIAQYAGNAESMKKTGGSSSSPYIRLFCQRSTMKRIEQHDPLLNGGWGFYTVEKVVDNPNSDQEKCHPVIELYLYKEG